LLLLLLLEMIIGAKYTPLATEHLRLLSVIIHQKNRFYSGLSLDIYVFNMSAINRPSSIVEIIA